MYLDICHAPKHTPDPVFFGSPRFYRWLTLFKLFVITLFFVYPVPDTLAQTSQQTSETEQPAPQTGQNFSLADQDYAAYFVSKHHSQKWDEIVKKGMEAFHADQYEEAHTLLYKAFNKGCESPIILFMMALINEQQKSFYTSLEYYQMAQKGFKSSNKDHRYSMQFDENYGRALYYSGKIDEAMPVLQKAGKRTTSYWLLKMLGMLAYEKGDALNALSYLERAVRVRSADVTSGELVYIYGLLGKLFLYQGQKDGAMRYYQKVLEIDPNHAEAKRFMQGINNQYQQQQLIDLMEKFKEM
ncbi:MAG: tetratricopeptide repeat protein [Deltaproteobacteria bacterium]|nr:tetratricopeptide repeat protein [Deltaproteobacteria bacterium]